MVKSLFFNNPIILTTFIKYYILQVKKIKGL